MKLLSEVHSRMNSIITYQPLSKFDYIILFYSSIGRIRIHKDGNLLNGINEINQNENIRDIRNNNIHLGNNINLEVGNNENNNSEGINRLNNINRNSINVLRINPQINNNRDNIRREEVQENENDDLNME